jgi:hypothetical protein
MEGQFLFLITMHKIMQLQYYNSNSILLVNALGLLRILYTPFRAITIEDLETIPNHTTVYVTDVFHTRQDILQYQVNDRLYCYKSFQIIINF